MGKLRQGGRGDTDPYLGRGCPGAGARGAKEESTQPAVKFDVTAVKFHLNGSNQL